MIVKMQGDQEKESLFEQLIPSFRFLIRIIIEKNERGLRIVIRKNFKISSSNGGDAGGLKNSMERVFSRKKH